MLIKALRVLKTTGKTLDASPKMQYQYHYFLQTVFGYIELKGKYNKFSVNANHMRVLEREREVGDRQTESAKGES